MWLIATKGSDLYDTSLQSGLTCLVNPFKMVWPVWQLFLSTRSSLYVKLLLKGNTQKNAVPVWQIASKHSGVYIKGVSSGTHHCVDGGIRTGDLYQLSNGTPTQSLSLL